MGNRRKKMSDKTEITPDSGTDRRSKSKSQFKNKNRTKKRSGKDRKQQGFVETTKGTCQLCKRSTIQDPQNSLNRGRLFTNKNITVHQFCMFFSTQGKQRGADDEGLFGFLPQDILSEIRRGDQLKCGICALKGATIECGKKGCKKTFHFCCGYLRNYKFVFKNTSKAYCTEHSNWNKPGKSETNLDCPICMEKVVNELCIKTACCNQYLHHSCIQQLALTQGSYHFKCPLCADTDKFEKKCSDSGIYIPVQDAKWETEDYFRYVDYPDLSCVASSCSCEDGVGRSRIGTVWELMKCDSCGGNPVHIHCGNLDMHAPDYICEDCNVDPEHSSTFPLQTLTREGEENATLDSPVPSSRRRIYSLNRSLMSSLENRKRKEKRKYLKTKKQENKVVSGEESCVPRKRKTRGSIEDNPTKRRRSPGLEEDILVPISCPHCAKELFFESTMEKHMKNMHGKTIKLLEAKSSLNRAVGRSKGSKNKKRGVGQDGGGTKGIRGVGQDGGGTNGTRGVGQNGGGTKGTKGEGQIGVSIKETRGVGQPEASTKGTRGVGQPEESTKGKRGVIGQPEESTKGTRGVGQPEESTKETRGVGQPEESTKGTRGVGQPKESTKEKRGSKRDKIGIVQREPATPRQSSQDQATQTEIPELCFISVETYCSATNQLIPSQESPDDKYIETITITDEDEDLDDYTPWSERVTSIVIQENSSIFIDSDDESRAVENIKSGRCWQDGRVSPVVELITPDVFSEVRGGEFFINGDTARSRTVERETQDNDSEEIEVITING